MCVGASVCVCVCVCVCVRVCVCVCVPPNYKVYLCMHEMEVGNYTQGAGALPGGLLPTKTPPGRGANVPEMVHLDGSVHKLVATLNIVAQRAAVTFSFWLVVTVFRFL